MALAVTVGSAQLLQLGVSLSDIALVYNQGKKLGSWFRVSSNDDELLGSIGEKLEAILIRRGLMDTSYMEMKWSRIDFVYQGNHHDNSSQIQSKEQAAGLSPFSWLMVTIVTALDLCLPSTQMESLIRHVLVQVLDRNSVDRELEDSLRVLLPTNVVSWRETGIVRSINITVSRAMKACRYERLRENALPQLNPAETKEMGEFLIWLLKGDSNTFNVMSVIVFAVAVGLGKAGVKLRTDGERKYETEPFVHYVENSDGRLPFLESHNQDPYDYDNYGIGRTAQQIAYPQQDPRSMVHSMPATRPTINSMTELWELGSQAASKMLLHAEAQLPFSPESEVYYTVENLDVEKSTFGKEVLLLAGRSFPERSESILLALESLITGIQGEQLEWLQQHIELGFLQRVKPSIVRKASTVNMELFLQYQSLVFGFYYKLLDQLVSFELVQETTYFKGLWGDGSTTFLAMCVEFGDIVRREGKISRTHVLYMLSTMYSGRQKPFSTLSVAKGLLGILGSISILAWPLLRTTDIPKEIASFMIVDLPILDLVPERDGELFASAGGGVIFGDYGIERTVHARSPREEWSLHAKMGLMVGDGLPGIVVAARCSGRLVGWFNPLAADVAFLSTAYQQTKHHMNTNHIDDYTFFGFEVQEEGWEAGSIPRPTERDGGGKIGIVQSKNCPAMRYAAAGIYTEVGWEVAIATDDIEAAFGRVDGQGEGLVIT